jgi:hypothetical protein
VKSPVFTHLPERHARLVDAVEHASRGAALNGGERTYTHTWIFTGNSHMSNTAAVDVIFDMEANLTRDYFNHANACANLVENYCVALVEASGTLDPPLAAQLVDIATCLRMRLAVGKFNIAVSAEHARMLLDLRRRAVAADAVLVIVDDA